MKNFTQLFLFLALTVSSFSIQAQQNSKVTGALSGFMKTKFMMKFQDIKTEAEGLANAFKAEQNNYSPRDRTRVATAYDKTVRRFNAVLIDIKNDFLDKNKLKVISKYPEMYGDGLRADMRDLTDYYAQNFQQALADVTNNQVDGSPIVLLLIELVSLSSEGITGLVQMRKNAKKYDEQYLTQHLVRPNQFKYWNQLGNDSYNNDNYNNDNDSYNNDNDNYNNDNDNYNNDTFEDNYDNNTNNNDNDNNDNNDNDNYDEDTYNNDSYNNTNNNDNTYNGNNSLNQNNNRNSLPRPQYDDIENFKFEKTPKTKNNINKNNTTAPKRKINTPTKGNRKVINPRSVKKEGF